MQHMDSGTFASSVLHPAKLQKLDWNTCLCHSGPVPSHEPLVAFGERSWKTLLQAASVRDDHLHAFLCGSGAGLDAPRGFYHRVCYQKYTHRQYLARLEESTGGEKNGDITSEQQQSGQGTHADSALSCSGHDGEARPSTPNSGCSHSQDAFARLTRSQVAKTDNKLCLFCQQETKKVKGSRQKPSNCMTLEACATLYEPALIREDDRVLLEVNPSLPDLVAKEICYHKVCYSRYTNPKALETNVHKESNGSSGSAYTRAFSRLASEIEKSPSTAQVMVMWPACLSYVAGISYCWRRRVLHWIRIARIDSSTGYVSTLKNPWLSFGHPPELQILKWWLLRPCLKVFSFITRQRTYGHRRKFQLLSSRQACSIPLRCLCPEGIHQGEVQALSCITARSIFVNKFSL